MDLSIIIVNYKNRQKLIGALNSISRADTGRLRYEIIVVDNNSGDDLRDFSKLYPAVKVLISPTNLGMGGGNNLGIKNSTGEFILILNPDTVIQGQALHILWDYLQAHPETGLIGPKLLYPDGSLQLSCSRFPNFFTPFLRRTFLGDYFKDSRDRFTMTDFDHRSIRPVDWLMGSCLMFRRNETSAAGVKFNPSFDKRYFMYFEDTDLARQIWTKGLKVVYNPEAVVIHDHQRQSAKHPWYLAIFLDLLAWRHIASWLQYFMKWGFKNTHYVQD